MANLPDKEKTPSASSEASEEKDPQAKRSLLTHEPQVSVRPVPPGRSFSRNASQAAQSGWDVVAKSVKSGMLQFVGLKPQKEERLHWDAIQQSIRESQLQRRPGFRPQRSTLSTTSHVSPRAAAPLPHPTLAHTPTAPSLSTTSPVDVPPRRAQSDSDEAIHLQQTLSEPGTATLRQMSLYSKRTGRNQAVRTELKPDVWKLAYLGVRKLAEQRREQKKTVAVPQKQKSFLDLGDHSDEEEGVEETDFGPTPSYIPSTLPTIAEQDDETFFGSEKHKEATDQPDVATGRYAPSLPVIEEIPGKLPLRPETPPSPPSSPAKRRRIGLPSIIHDPLFGGYDRGYGGLGLPTLLLRFKYKKCPHSVQRELDKQLLHKRPYFTYWLIVVHIIIMIVSLSVYGFAPYGWDRFTESDTIRQSNLAFETTRRTVTPSVWGGSRQMDLVLLGALYGPCMRRDRQLFNAIDNEIRVESNSSGCCVQRDGSGCVQVESESNCPERFADFSFTYNGSSNQPTRVVCGTSPLTCEDPDPNFFPADRWIPSDITTWPICQRQTENPTEDHLRCDLTGRPCCVGIQANCLITTREECDYLLGRFHQDAFLCSQVDCLNDICGLLPFRVFNQPDQVYRLWIALFLHAGLIHLFLSLLFTFFVLRHVEKRLGWFRTTFLYVLSGIGGNLVSVYFVPFNPGVGPAPSILGVVAYFFIFLIFESRLLVKPWLEFLKLLGIVIFLFLLGLLPFIDNIAHIGGFVFGFFLSGIIVPYGPYRKIHEIQKVQEDKTDKFLIIKIVMVAVGIPVVIGLFVLFFLLFYLLQDTWEGFGYLSCIPFTSTICNDVRPILRSRDEFFV